MSLLTEMNEAGPTIIMATHSPAGAEYSQRIVHTRTRPFVIERLARTLPGEAKA